MIIISYLPPGYQSLPTLPSKKGHVHLNYITANEFDIVMIYPGFFFFAENIEDNFRCCIAD